MLRGKSDRPDEVTVASLGCSKVQGARQVCGVAEQTHAVQRCGDAEKSKHVGRREAARLTPLRCVRVFQIHRTPQGCGIILEPSTGLAVWLVPEYRAVHCAMGLFLAISQYTVPRHRDAIVLVLCSNESVAQAQVSVHHMHLGIWLHCWFCWHCRCGCLRSID